MLINKSRLLWLRLRNKYKDELSKQVEIDEETYQQLINIEYEENNSNLPRFEITYIDSIVGDFLQDGHEEILDLDHINNIFDNDNNIININSETPLCINIVGNIYAKYNNDTYDNITYKCKYSLSKNIGNLQRTGLKYLTYYPPEIIDENEEIYIIGEYNYKKFIYQKIIINQ